MCAPCPVPVACPCLLPAKLLYQPVCGQDRGWDEGVTPATKELHHHHGLSTILIEVAVKREPGVDVEAETHWGDSKVVLAWINNRHCERHRQGLQSIAAYFRNRFHREYLILLRDRP